MHQICLLFKKDLIEKFSNAFRKNKSQILGFVLTTLLMATLYGTFIFVYYRFAKMYLNQVFDNPLNQKTRIFELMTLTYGFIIILNIFISIKQIYKTLFSTKDMEVLISQPLRWEALFCYKIIKIYAYQCLSTILFVIPIGIVVASICPNLLCFRYVITLILHIFMIPMISCAAASIGSIGYNYILDFIENRFILRLIIYIIILGVCFYAYSAFLKILSTMLQNGDIAYFFELKRINYINTLSNSLFPINYLGKMLVNNHYFLSFMIILGFSLFCLGISALVNGGISHRILQKKLEGRPNTLKSVKSSKHQHSTFVSLIDKEFIVVLRTPDYAFQYFATAVAMPLMVYVCVSLMQKMVLKIPLLAFISLDYEISLLVVSMFVVISNTFCSTNISRDGNMVYILKTLPVKGKTIVLSKVVFCFIVSTIAIFLSLLMLLVMGFLRISETIVIFVIASLISISEIMIATRHDLNNLQIDESNNQEQSDENIGTSFLIFLGIVISLFMGVGSIIIHLICENIWNSLVASIFVTIFLGIISVSILLISCGYLFKGLDKKYYEIED